VPSFSFFGPSDKPPVPSFSFVFPQSTLNAKKNPFNQ
jgi:hypothetical protein